jgi:hypothetical protein
MVSGDEAEIETVPCPHRELSVPTGGEGIELITACTDDRGPMHPAFEAWA